MEMEKPIIPKKSEKGYKGAICLNETEVGKVYENSICPDFRALYTSVMK